MPHYDNSLRGPRPLARPTLAAAKKPAASRPAKALEDAVQIAAAAPAPAGGAAPRPLAEPRIGRRFGALMVHDKQVNGYPDHKAASKMVKHLRHMGSLGGPHAAEYQRAAKALAGGVGTFNWQGAIDLLPRAAAMLYTGGLTALLPGKKLTAWVQGKRLLAQVHKQGQAVVLNGLPGHATLTQIIADKNAAGSPTGTYTLRVFNTGAGLDHHTQRRDVGANKWQTMYEVRNVSLGAGKGHLSAYEIGRMINFRDLRSLLPESLSKRAPQDLYKWASAKGEVHNPPAQPVQAMQKEGTCAYKCVLAYLRANLSDTAYTQSMAKLHAHAFASQQARNPEAPLTAALEGKASAAALKASVAARRSDWVQQGRDQPWFHETADRAQLRHAVGQAAKSTRKPAFLVAHLPDSRELVLVHAQPGKDAEVTPFKPVRGGFSVRWGKRGLPLPCAKLSDVAAILGEGHGVPVTQLPTPRSREAMAAAWQAQGAQPSGYLGAMHYGEATALFDQHAPSGRGLFGVRYDPAQQRFVAWAQGPAAASQEAPARHQLTFDLDPYTGQASANVGGRTLAVRNLAALCERAQVLMRGLVGETVPLKPGPRA